MTSIIFGEAGATSEGWLGKLAVGWVVMNRLAAQSPAGWTAFTRFGRTIRQIIQGGNFDAYTRDRGKWDRAMSYHTQDDFAFNRRDDIEEPDRGQLLESLRAAKERRASQA